jgi:hypothetical protein
VFEKANHGFFAAITGGRREGPSLKGLVPGYLQTRVDWLRQHLDDTPAEDVATGGAPDPTPASVSSSSPSTIGEVPPDLSIL